MRMFLRHPSFARLSRFADGELSGRRRERTARHLAECARCREEVAFIRRAGEVARSIPARPPSDDLLEDILERRAAGERVLLPTSNPDPPVRRRRRFPLAFTRSHRKTDDGEQ